MKKSLAAFLLLLSVSVCGGQTPPRFKGHGIGETAHQFFRIATKSETRGQLAAEYCKAYLADPERIRAYEMVQQHDGDHGVGNYASLTNDELRALSLARLRSSDVADCRKVEAALAGKDVVISAAVASELLPGAATFHNGQLVELRFTVSGIYEDVRTDMENKLGFAPKSGTHTFHSRWGPVLRRTATWRGSSSLVARVEENISDVTVFVADRQWRDPQDWETRRNTLD